MSNCATKQQLKMALEALKDFAAPLPKPLTEYTKDELENLIQMYQISAESTLGLIEAQGNQCKPKL